MNFKNVCQIDDFGYFLGLTMVQESPEEPGVWLLPPDCVDVEPPTQKPGFLVRLDEHNQWVYEQFDQQQLSDSQLQAELSEEDYFYIEKAKKYESLTYCIDDFTIELDFSRVMAFKLYLLLPQDEFVVTNDSHEQRKVTKEQLNEMVLFYARKIYELDNMIWK